MFMPRSEEIVSPFGVNAFWQAASFTDFQRLNFEEVYEQRVGGDGGKSDGTQKYVVALTEQYRK